MATAQNGYENDFYISSSRDNLPWVEKTTEYLESKHLKGVYEERDKVGGVPETELAQHFIKTSHKVIIGFGGHDEREKYKSLDTLQDIFCKNDRDDSYRLIPVKLSKDCYVPECLSQLVALEAWDPGFNEQLLRSVRFTKKQRHTGGAASLAYGVNCTEGPGRRKENSRTQGAATQDSRKGPCMSLHHQDLLRKHKEYFAKDLPYQRVLDHMSEVFSLEDESEIKKDCLSDFNKRRTLIDILVTKGPKAFPKFVKVLEKECPHLAKPLKAESLREQKVTKQMKGMKIT
ncbi:uncharacterized protein [Ptychodera flava]|uniref:uncharacterized protein isoform X2 n=1 Tax=Ptychodera flava TaxID=63121 RepID=UPI00396A5CC4